MPGSPEVPALRERRVPDHRISPTLSRWRDLAARAARGLISGAERTLSDHHDTLACSQERSFRDWRASDRSRPVADIDGSLRFFAAIVTFMADAGV
jgi:hypothetical protein